MAGTPYWLDVPTAWPVAGRAESEKAFDPSADLGPRQGWAGVPTATQMVPGRGFSPSSWCDGFESWRDAFGGR